MLSSPLSACCRALPLALGLALLGAPAAAELTRVDVDRREDVLGGKSFGSAGPYEKLVGRAFFAVDPANTRNRVIADLDKAPRNAQGQVEFSADLYILKPKDPARGNGVLFFDMVNRGNMQLLAAFSRAGRSADPTTEADFGDAYLLEQGYTLVGVGWQFDVRDDQGPIRFRAPVATDGGKPLTGWVRMWFVSNSAADAVEYTRGYNTAAYLPLDPDNPGYRLTMREGVFAPPRLVPRSEWRFARVENGRIVADPKFVYLTSGVKPGYVYEVAFETKDPPVAGLGFAAIRDMASALKHDPSAVAPGKYAYMYGSSQTGRSIRQFVYEGFTIDERERKAIDAAFVNTGAAGMGSFNQRFAQPNELGSFTQSKLPTLYRPLVDPLTGREDALGTRIPAGLEPKLMLFDSASEYWDRGRVAALRHTSLDGSEDLEDAPNVRVYMVAGTKHGAGSFPPADNGGQFRENTNNYRWAQRGLLASLDAWVRHGTAPPPSRHPRLVDGTLVAHRDLKFPAIPGVQWPTHVPGGFRPDVPGPDSVLPFLLPAIDADGNDIGGIRLPEQAVPLATLTGWQFRSERIGLPHTLLAMAGAYIPFPLTRAERERTGDPRLSIEERYPSRDDYLAKVRQAAIRLAQERYLIEADVDPIVEDAARHWDWLVGGAGGTTPSAR